MTLERIERLVGDFLFHSAEDAISLFVFLDDALEPYRVTVHMLAWLRGFHRSTELRLIQCIPLTRTDIANCPPNGPRVITPRRPEFRVYYVLFNLVRRLSI